MSEPSWWPRFSVSGAAVSRIYLVDEHTNVVVSRDRVMVARHIPPVRTGGTEGVSFRFHGDWEPLPWGRKL